MRKAIFLSVLMLFLFGCSGDSDKPEFTQEQLAAIPLAQRNGLPAASGGFVLNVGGETITGDEIVVSLVEHLRELAQQTNFEQFKRQAKGQVEQVVVTKISNILLYQQAKRQAGEDVDEPLEKLAEAEVRKFIASFGGDSARAQEALKKMGMDWAGFKQYQKRLILSQSYVASKLPDEKAVTYSELLDGYNQMKDEFFFTPAMIKIRLIDIQADKLQAADPNTDTQKQAEQLAEQLLRRIRSGEDFGALAKQYSHGHRAAFGGLWKPVNPNSLAKPYDILAAEAEKINTGQIAGPVEAGKHIFIMKLEEKQRQTVEPFEKVQSRVEAKILFDRRRKAVDDFGLKLVRQAALSSKDAFINFCLLKCYLIGNE